MSWLRSDHRNRLLSTSGFTWLFAVSVGFGLENRPTLGCGGGATAFGGAGGSLGCSGWSSFTGLGISGGGWIFGIVIFGGVSFTTSGCGGANTFTLGTTIFGGGGNFLRKDQGLVILLLLNFMDRRGEQDQQTT